MKKDKDFFLINPGGNITALFKHKYNIDKLSTSKEILKIYPIVEQVGFYKVNFKKDIFYLEMTGNEFCGNALKSFAFLLKKKYNIEKIYIQTNVFNEKILCTVNNSNTVKIYFPKKFIQNKKNHIILGNIGHTISKRKKPIKIFNDCQASGLILYKEKNDSYEIEPHILVHCFNKEIIETSCLSGSLTLFIMKNKKNMKIKQPSGDLISFKDSKNYILISGKVNLL